MDEYLTTAVKFMFHGEIETKNNRPLFVCIVRNIGHISDNKRTFTRKILKKIDVSKMDLFQLNRFCNNLYLQKGYDYLGFTKYKKNCYHGHSIEVVFNDGHSGVFFGSKNL